jgi:hypothetical protein
VPFQAFPIRNFTKGKVKSKEPWLIPEDAFESLSNGYIRNGILQKRLGYSKFADMVHFVPAENVPDTGQSATHTILNLPVRALKAGSVVITDSGGGPQTLTDDGNGGFTGDGTTSTIDYITGAVVLEWDAATTGAVQIAYSYIPGNAIMGIANHLPAAGGANLLSFDTRRVAKWNVANSEFDDIALADRFSGNNSQSFHWANWAGTLYFTNNNDVLDSYDGSTLSKPTVDIGAGTIAFTCLLVFQYKDHLICFRTTEGGTLHAQRARWATAGGVDFTNDGFVDAPTSEFIKGGAFLGDDLVLLFERSIWFLKHTQDTNLPFRWERIDGFNGTFAKNSVLPFADEVTAISASKVISTDGFSARMKNIDIPDIVQSFAQDSFDFIYSIFLEELDLQFTCYPDSGSTINDKTLVYNKLNKTWSTFSIGFHSLGIWVQDADLTWNTYGELTWDEVEAIWDANTTQAGFPITLGGTSSGIIYKLNEGSADNGSPFEFSAVSKRWNPYIDKGFKAKLGYIDFLVDKDPTIELDVALFINQDPTAYQTDTLTFDGDDDKVWKRVYSGVTGEFHQIKMSKSASGQTPKIHASGGLMIYWEISFLRTQEQQSRP